MLLVATLVTWYLGCRSGFYTGYQRGIKDGQMTGEWVGSRYTAMSILQSLQFQDNGKAELGSKFLTGALYYNAYFMDANKDFKLLKKGDREACDELLKSVGEYYWRHPDTLNLDISKPKWEAEDPNSMASVALAQKFNAAPVEMREMLKRYRPN